MTLTIELKPELENLLRHVAKERGVSLEEVIADRLNRQLSEDLGDELAAAGVEPRVIVKLNP